MPLSPSQIEQRVIKILEKHFKQKLNKHAKLMLQKSKSDGQNHHHKFDFASTNNKTIVGEIKSSKYGNKTTKNAGYTSTLKWRLLGDIFYLEKVKATKKFLILTDRNLYDHFKKDFDSLTPVKILHVSVSNGKVTGG